MKFKINNSEWNIEEISKDKLKMMYEEEMQERTYYVFRAN